MALNPSKVGTLHPTVGVVGDRQIAAWFPSSECNESCSIWDQCSRKGLYNQKIGSPCGLESVYLRTVYGSLISEDPEKGIADKLDDIELYRVGYHLMPLYRQLILLKKEEFAIKNITSVDKAGKLQVNPVLKEIRDVITKISKEISDLGLHKKWKEKFGTVGGPGFGPSVDDLMEHGDPGYYDRMAGTSTKKKYK